VVPKRRSEAGSGVGLMGPEELASPNAKTESCKEWNPGVSPSKKISEPESKLLQLLEQLLKFESRVLLSRITEKLASENENSLWPVEGIKDELRFRLKETVNGKVTVVAFRLIKVACLVALALESAKEEPGPLAKPVTSAVAPFCDNDAAPVARELPLKNWEEDVLPDKKEMLVPDGIPEAETEACTRSL
jgi:hypothetical protein